MSRASLRGMLFGLLLAAGGLGAQEFQAGAPQAKKADGGLGAARIHTELASMYFQDGKVAIALEELGLALVAFPKYAPAYSLAGVVHAFIRENDKAEALFKKAIDLAPNDPEINNNYGWFLCQTGKERQSLTYFLEAVKNPLYTTPDIAYANAGGCALKAGDLQGAETYLNQAIRLSGGGSAPARIQLAQLRYRQGAFEETRKLANALLKELINPSAELIWLALRAERKLGNRVAESTLAAQLRGRHPESREYQDFLKGNFE